MAGFKKLMWVNFYWKLHITNIEVEKVFTSYSLTNFNKFIMKKTVSNNNGNDLSSLTVKAQTC